jgi:hypothetical protein
MTIRYRGHNYNTQFKHAITGFTHWWNIKGFVSAVWRGEKYLTWVGHGDGCCDYWIPVDDPRAKRELILDDELGLATPTQPPKKDNL